jgi:hypothetical protein
VFEAVRKMSLTPVQQSLKDRFASIRNLARKHSMNPWQGKDAQTLIRDVCILPSPYSCTEEVRSAQPKEPELLLMKFAFAGSE